MNFSERPIAITDVETTGLDPDTHEIVEIGLVVVNQQTLGIMNSLDVQVRPQRPEVAAERALGVNGYNEKDWRNALSLKKAMDLYSKKTKDAIFCAHNMTFDWSFIERAFAQNGIENRMDYHRIDLFTMAWEKLRNCGLTKFSLDIICDHLGIPREPRPHRGINGATTEYLVLKRLLSL